MRRSFLLILIVLTLLLLAAGVVLAVQRQAFSHVTASTGTEESAETAAVRRVTVQQLRGQLAMPNPPLVWDFRPVSTFAEGHIPGSHVLTLDTIPDAAANLDRRLPIVTVCA